MSSTDESAPGERDGYRATFKSSSMLGGSQGICYILGFVRTKALALLLGPDGVGLVGLYGSIGGVVGTLAGLGISESSVREVATAHGTGDPRKFARTVKVIRRASLLSGILGLLLSVVFAIPLSNFSFDNASHAWAIAILGIPLLLNAIAGGEMALLQGAGQVGKVARMNILSSVASILPIVIVYLKWRDAGIVPAMLLASVLALGVYWYFSRTIPVERCEVSWMETLSSSRSLMALGFAFMLTGLLWTGKDMAIRAIITQKFGLNAAGIYQSAWGISGLFVNFVLRAMGMDFYPRLTAMLDNHTGMVKAVNQQIEIGVLLALPGVIATITCAPMILLILYTSKFYDASDLLAIMACGVFFKVISYPLNIIQLAKGDARGFATFGILFAVAEIVLSIGLLNAWGLIGAAIAYPTSTLLHVFAMAWVGRKLIDYKTGMACLRLLLVAGAMIAIGLVLAFTLKGYAGLGAGLLLFSVSAVFSTRGLAHRLGRDHRIVKMFLKIPGGKLLV